MSDTADTTLKIKRGDRLPALVVQLTVDGDPFDATGHTVRLKARHSAGVVVIDQPMSAQDLATGVFSYAWAEADTAAPGGLDLEFEATHTASGLVRTFPDEGFASVEITQDL